MEISDRLLSARLAPYGVSVTPALASSIQIYLELLGRWNSHMSLTSLRFTDEALERHFGESFFIAHAAQISGGRLADVGSGAGFPGVPIKLIVPGIQLTLIESNSKKAVFLSELIRALELTEVEILKRRFEAISSFSLKQDSITSRALGDWPRFLGWASRQLVSGGKLILSIGWGDAEKLIRTPGWIWLPTVHIPRSKQRVLLIGSPG